MKKITIFMVAGLILWTLLNYSPLFPCSTFVIGEGDRLYFGRNYDFFTGTGFIVVNPRGLDKTALVYPGENPAAWTAEYGSVTFNQAGREFPMGGMNEAGLVVENMWLSQTQFPMADSRPAVMELQYMQYLLDTCGSLADVLASDEKIRIQQRGQTIHFLVCDRQGNTAVIEFINFRTFAYPVKPGDVRVLTNSSYSDCLTYLNRFKGFGGKEKIQETIYSLDRFVRLATAAREKRADPEKAFAMLDMVHCEEKEAQTQWRIVYDPVRLVIRFKTRGDDRQYTLRFKDFTFDCTHEAMVMDLDAQRKKNILENFVSYTPEINSRFVKRTFDIYRENKFVTDIPDMYLAILGNYPSTLKCHE